VAGNEERGVANLACQLAAIGGDKWRCGQSKSKSKSPKAAQMLN